jgi:hypothetical protein
VRWLLILLAFTLASPASGNDRWPSSLIQTGANGLQGTVGTSRTLAYLAAQPGLKTDSRVLRRTLYFDAYLGNDSTGNGSQELPYRSLGKAKTECRTYTRCIFKSDRVWSPKTFTVTDLGAAGDDFIIGETISYAGPSTARVIDWQVIDGTAYLVAEDLTGTTLGAVAITGTSSGATGTTSAAIDTLGAAGNDQITPNAAAEFADNVVILFEGDLATTDRNKWPLVHCNNDSPAGSGGVGIYPGSGSGFGWTAMQRFRFSRCRDDIITSTSGAGQNPKVLAFNVDCIVVNGPGDTDAANNCFTIHGDSGAAMVVVNGRAKSFQTSTGGSGSPIALNEASSLFLNFEAVNDVSGGASGTCSAIAVTGGEHTLINGRTFHTGSIVGAWPAAFSIRNQQPTVGDLLPDTKIRLAHVSFNSITTVNGFLGSIDASPGTHAVDVRGWNLSFRGGRGIFFKGHASRSGDIIDLRRVILDGIAGDYYLWSDTNPQNLLVTLEGAYDDADTATTWHLASGDHTTRAAFAAAAPGTWSIFASNSTDLNGGDAYGGSLDLPCFDSTKTACWNAAPNGSYFVSLPAVLTGRVPAELVDGVTKLTGFQLGGGTDSNGAW